MPVDTILPPVDADAHCAWCHRYVHPSHQLWERATVADTWLCFHPERPCSENAQVVAKRRSIKHAGQSETVEVASRGNRPVCRADGGQHGKPSDSSVERAVSDCPASREEL